MFGIISADESSVRERKQVQTESSVQVDWRNLFATANGQPSIKTFQMAEELLEQLPPTSPVRSRLTAELDEIRKLHST